MSTKAEIITRFPPSPTGRFHVGSARTTLFNYVFAKQNNGEFILRFEDTDRARSKQEFETDIIDGLTWLGVTDYKKPFRQSERGHVYKGYLEKMINDGFAYVSDEDPKEEGQRSSVIRFKNPNTIITFSDIIRGEISVDTTDLGDFIIAKSTEEPLYNLSVVIDDYEGGVTYVIRGEDHISNTPRQILILQAIGANMPVYAHIPMVLGNDKSKLSKRHGATALVDYRDKGYLAPAMFNYLMLLGWHPGDGEEEEIFTFEEIAEKFELEKVQKSGAVFSEEKLRWVNKQHLDKLSDGIFYQESLEWLPNEIKALPQFDNDRFARYLPELRERISVYSDIETMSAEGELDYIFDKPGYFAKDIIWKKSDLKTTTIHLRWLLKTINQVASSVWENIDSIKETIWPYADREGRGDVLWPLRYSLSGVERSPSPFSLLFILGKQESINRIEAAITALEELD